MRLLNTKRLITSIVVFTLLYSQVFSVGTVLGQVREDNGHVNFIKYMPPNPNVYPEFYDKGDKKDRERSFDTEAVPKNLPRMTSSSNRVASKQMIPAAGNTEKLLIIPIDFSDVHFSSDHSQGYFNSMARGMKEYYEKNSDYLANTRGMTIDATVTAVVRSQHPMAYYGADGTDIDNAVCYDGDANDNGEIYELTREAVKLLDEQAAGFDFTPYDNNSDGEIDHILVIHAGAGQEAVNDTDLIWSHRYQIDSGEVVDGKMALNYTMVPETGTLGVFVHEFGHDIGLPDLYDTDGLENGYSEGVGDWDVMGSGSWNAMPGDEDGSCPANLSAWSKLYLNWIAPEEVISDKSEILTNNDGNSTVLRLWPKGDSGNAEYFLVEYRRKANYDAGLPGEGVIVWHIDQQWINAAFDYNMINAFDGRLGVELEQADGKWDLWYAENRGDEGDPFPGSSDNHNFNAVPYKLNYSNITFDGYTYVDMSNINIAGSTATMDIKVTESIPAAPALKAPLNNSVADTQPTFYWELSSNAKQYKLQISPNSRFDGSPTEIVLKTKADGLGYINNSYSYTLPASLSLENGSIYYWRVAAINDKSEFMLTPAWSAASKFNTEYVTDNIWAKKNIFPQKIWYTNLLENNGELYLAGALLIDRDMDEIYKYDAALDSWALINDFTWVHSVMYYGAVSLNNSIYLLGGWNGDNAISELNEYDISTHTWIARASMGNARYLHSTVAVNGKIYAIGGKDEYSLLKSVEEYDPVTDAWTTKADMPFDGNYQEAVAFNGKIYVFIGEDTHWIKVLVYNPDADTWTEKNDMPTTAASFGVAVYNDLIYAVGGNHEPYRNQTQIYNTENDSWTAGPKLPEYRIKPGICSADGKLIIVGGADVEGGSVALKDTVYEYVYNTEDLTFPINIDYTNTLSQISLEWDSVENATGYIVNTDQTDIYVPSNLYIFTGTRAGEQHSFKVKAVNEGRCSDWSDEITAYTAGIPSITSDIANWREGNEDTSTITIHLDDGVFRTDGIYNKSTVIISNIPAGVTIDTVDRIDSDTLEIALSGNSTEDYDQAITLNIKVSKYLIENMPVKDLVTNAVIPAVVESKPAAPAGITFSFDGNNANKLVGVTEGMEYSIDGGINYYPAVTSNMIMLSTHVALITDSNNIKIRIAATLRASASNSFIIDILPGPAAPSLSANNTTNTLADINSTMEFSTNGIAWTKYSNNLPDLSGNITIYVRIASNGNTLPGAIGTYTYTASSSGGGGGGGGGGTVADQPVVTSPVVPPVIPPVVENMPATSTPVYGGILIDSNRLDAEINDITKKSIVVFIPEDVMDQSVLIDSDVLRKLTENNKVLIIQSEYVSFTLPPNFINKDMLNDVDKSAQFKLGVKIVSTADAGTKYGLSIDGKDKGLFSIGNNVFELESEIISGSKTQKLSNLTTPITVTISLSQADTNDIGNDKLGLYYFNTTLRRWEFVGGIYNPETNSISFDTSHFSLYAIMKFNGSFADISYHWAKIDIEKMALRKIAKGKTIKEFKPEDTITRAEFTVLLVRALELKGEKSTYTPYKDVNQSKWYSGELGTAYNSKIVLKSDGVTFRPEIEITREEMAVLLARALKLKGQESKMSESQIREVLAKFKDENTITTGAKASLAFIVDRRLMNGRTSNMLEPKSNMTRAEAITMISRMLDLLKI